MIRFVSVGDEAGSVGIAIHVYLALQWEGRAGREGKLDKTLIGHESLRRQTVAVRCEGVPWEDQIRGG